MPLSESRKDRTMKKDLIQGFICGLIGLAGLICVCLNMTKFGMWAATYSSFWVYFALFIVMMIIGSLLNKGVSTVRLLIQKRK